MASRAGLIIKIVSLMLERTPASWTIAELALATARTRRAVERAIVDLIDARLVEKHYHSYRLSLDIYNKIYKSQWFVKNETEKELWLEKKKSHNA